jgi:hypothetical protein
MECLGKHGTAARYIGMRIVLRSFARGISGAMEL